MFTKQGDFHPLPGFDRALDRAVEETFRRLLLTRLYKERRLSARFLDSLLSWRHRGLSVFVRQHIQNEEPARLSHLARYLAAPQSRRTGSEGPEAAPHFLTGGIMPSEDLIDRFSEDLRVRER